MSGSEARQRIAQKQADARAGAQRRRRRRLVLQLGIGAAVVALAAAVVVVVTALLPRGGSAVAGPSAQRVAAAVASVPASTLDAVGAGPRAATAPVAIRGAALTSGGEPEVLYVGAEYCPFCAAERWALAQALSRFGTLSGVGLTTSSHDDEFPDTSTLSFAAAHYDSRYVAFVPREIEDRDRAPLQSLTASQSALLAAVDQPPVSPQGAAGSIPFIDVGGRFAESGAQVDPVLLQGMSWTEIAAAMRDPGSAVGKAEDGAANTLTAAICTATGQQPAAVCTAPGVTAAKAGLRG